MSLLLFLGGEKAAKLGGGSDPPDPSPGVTSSLRAPGAQQPGMAQQGQAGWWEAAFNFISAWEKFPFMWLPVISPGGSAEGGRPVGSRGRCYSPGHPHPLHKANCSTCRSFWGQGGSSLGEWGWEAWPAGGTRAGGPGLPPPGCWQCMGRRWPRPALVGMPTGVGWMALVPAPRGVCCDSASLSPFRVPARSPTPGLTLHHRETWSLRPCTSSNFILLGCALWRGQA